jgi:hypothetical protein
MDQHEAAAAQIARPRQSDSERETDRDGRIDRISSTLQNVQSNARRRRFLGHDHAVLGDDRTRGGQWRDDGIGNGKGWSNAKKGKGSELKRSQRVFLETWLAPP